MQARVLVVDDEADIRNSVRRGLQAQGFDVETAVDGIDGLARIERWRPDVVLMDLAMPRMGGISAIQELRTWSDVPVIVLSVMGEEGEKVRALDAGADDYLTKPFGIQELGARVRVALRHMSLAQSDTIRELGSVSVDLSSRVVRVDRDEVHLSPIEYELLKHLVINAGRVLTHGQLLERVWGPEYRTETAYLRPIVTSLRKKLGPRFIRTEPGVGYRVPLETA
ncbi:MAG TPA: response regulator transcription factor [Chloroflexota bacterium]|nr:response regulator transcription factor [Chloroflexota bacterium]